MSNCQMNCKVVKYNQTDENIKTAYGSLSVRYQNAKENKSKISEHTAAMVLLQTEILFDAFKSAMKSDLERLGLI